MVLGYLPRQELVLFDLDKAFSAEVQKWLVSSGKAMELVDP